MAPDWSSETYWETRFRQEDTPWDLGEASPTLIALERESPLQPGAAVIVPGCGRGYDALHFSKLGYHVSAVDWSASAIQSVSSQARRQQLGLEALRSSFWDIPTSWYGTFDAWIEHTFFCAIDPSERQRYVRQSLNLLKPGGRILGVFFVGEERPDGPPFLVSEKELRSLFEPHFEILQLEPSRTRHPRRTEIVEWAASLKRR